MTELDRLLVRIEGDTAPLEAALARVGTGARAAGDAVAEGLAAAPGEGLVALAGTLDDVAETLAGTLGRALGGSIDGWEELRRVALSVLDDILRALIKTGGRSGSGAGILEGLIGTFSGGFEIPGLAGGGRVEPGGLYQVGEAGRELFVPDVPGKVVPSPASDRLLAGAGRGLGAVQIHNSYSIDARGAQQGVGAEIVAALDARSARIRSEAVDQVFALIDRGGRYAKTSGRR